MISSSGWRLGPSTYKQHSPMNHVWVWQLLLQHAVSPSTLRILDALLRGKHLQQVFHSTPQIGIHPFLGSPTTKYGGFRVDGTNPMMSFRWGSTTKPPTWGIVASILKPPNMLLTTITSFPVLQLGGMGFLSAESAPKNTLPAKQSHPSRCFRWCQRFFYLDSSCG